MRFDIGTLFSYNSNGSNNTTYTFFEVIDRVQRSWGINYTLQYEYLNNPGIKYTTTWNESTILNAFKLAEVPDFELEFSI